VQERLRRAHDEGRLDLVEFDERVRTLWATRTRGDLARITADLPAPAAPVGRAGVFSATPGGMAMRVLTLVVIVSLGYHAWVGMRDVWMDYVKPMGARLLLQVFTIVWLIGCAGWAIQVLWRL